jgi:hypothetical protein
VGYSGDGGGGVGVFEDIVVVVVVLLRHFDECLCCCFVATTRDSSCVYFICSDTSIPKRLCLNSYTTSVARLCGSGGGGGCVGGGGFNLTIPRRTRTSVYDHYSDEYSDECGYTTSNKI